jgi:hypothetical protein
MTAPIPSHVDAAPIVPAFDSVGKSRPNNERTLQILRSMTPAEKLAQVFKLNERTLKLFRIGLRQRFPDLDDSSFEKLYLQMPARCHNWNEGRI